MAAIKRWYWWQSAGDVMKSLSLWRHAAACAHTQTDRQNDRQNPSEHIISTIHYVHLAEIINAVWNYNVATKNYFTTACFPCYGYLSSPNVLAAETKLLKSNFFCDTYTINVGLFQRLW